MKAVLGRMFRVAWGGRSKPGNLRCPVLFSSQLVSFSTNTAVRKILTGKSRFSLQGRKVMMFDGFWDARGVWRRWQSNTFCRGHAVGCRHWGLGTQHQIGESTPAS